MQRWGRIAVLCAPALALLPGGARAQDVFAAGASPQGQTVSDSFSSSCIQAQKPNIFKQLGVNPLTCHAGAGLQDSQGQCMNGNGITVIAHQGTECYYCTPNNPPVVLYIPMDQVQNASLQGFLCGVSSVDPGCMAACSKEFSTTTVYVPPPQTTGGGVPLTATVTNDPCEPNYDMSTAAGQAQAQANAAKDAAACNESRCQHNPQLDVCKTVVTVGTQASGGPPVSAQNIPGMTSVPPCAEDTRKDSVGWTPQSMATLLDAVNNAKQMLQAAQTYTNKKEWDPGTVKQATLWFGNASPATQQTIRNNISGALVLIQNMQTPNDAFYVGIPSDLKPADQKTTVAYVLNSLESETSPTIFIMPLFWIMPATGNDSQASTVVHELSHYRLGGGTDDVNYGEGLCKFQVYADPYLPILGAINLAVLTSVSIVPGVNTSQGQSMMLKWATGTASITNADSFKYFVYYVSQQK